MSDLRFTLTWPPEVCNSRKAGNTTFRLTLSPTRLAYLCKYAKINHFRWNFVTPIKILKYILLVGGDTKMICFVSEREMKKKKTISQTIGDHFSKLTERKITILPSVQIVVVTVDSLYQGPVCVYSGFIT